MATDTFKKLAAVNNVAVGLTTYYTCPAATVTAVVSYYMTNTTGAAIVVSLKVSGTTRISAYSLPANSTVSYGDPRPLGMAATETIQASAAATGVDLHVSGVETA